MLLCVFCENGFTILNVEYSERSVPVWLCLLTWAHSSGFYLRSVSREPDGGRNTAGAGFIWDKFRLTENSSTPGGRFRVNCSLKYWNVILKLVIWNPPRRRSASVCRERVLSSRGDRFYHWTVLIHGSVVELKGGDKPPRQTSELTGGEHSRGQPAECWFELMLNECFSSFSQWIKALKSWFGFHLSFCFFTSCCQSLGKHTNIIS